MDAEKDVNGFNEVSEVIMDAELSTDDIKNLRKVLTEKAKVVRKVEKEIAKDAKAQAEADAKNSFMEKGLEEGTVMIATIKDSQAFVIFHGARDTRVVVEKARWDGEKFVPNSTKFGILFSAVQETEVTSPEQLVNDEPAEEIAQ
jgi:hypothetical protein